MADFDFLAHCRPGMTLHTADRRPVTVVAVDPAAGLIHGEIPMHGACSWRADGLWTEAPCGASGPLDLVPPPAAAPEGPKRASLVDALDGTSRHFCCD